MAQISGDLASKGVPELFRAIAEENRTGRLTVTRVQRENGQLHGQESLIYFRRGDAYHARLVGTGIRLGDRLISAGLVTQEDIDAALEVQSSEGGQRRLGQVLLDSSQITFDQLDAIVRQQIEDTIFEILRWEGGKFTFESDLLAEEDIGIKVSVENLVMESARRFREWHQISRVVPSLEAVPRFNDEEGGSVEVALTPEEWSFVSRVDGRHTINQLAKACGFTDLEAGRTVFGLVTAGLLTLDLPTGVEVPAEDPDMEAAFDELEKELQEATTGEGPSRSLAELATVVDEKEEAERLEAERLEAERIEAERIEAERAEAERLESERVEAEREKARRAEEERASEVAKAKEAARLKAQREEAKRVKEERAAEAAKAADARLEAEREEAARLEAEREEAARLEAEAAAEAERLEAERLETERAAARLASELAEQEREEAETADIQIVPVEPEIEEVEAEAEKEFEEYAATAPTTNGAREVSSVIAAPATDESTPVEQVASSNILSEEKVEEGDSRTYVRLFAELSAGGLKEEEKQAEKTYPTEEPEEEPTPPPAKEASRPVDPLVDTNALFREFSALGTEEEGSSELPGFDTKQSSQKQEPVEDKGRGFFGRKKR